MDEVNQDFSNEFDEYLNDNDININTSAITWWMNKKDVFPQLFNYFINFIIIPSSSTVEERENSNMGRIVTKTRASLKPENVSMLSFLKSNKDLW